MRGIVFGITLVSAATGFAQDRDVLNRVFGNVPAVASSSTDPEIPPGTIEVEVVDDNGALVEEAAVRLGVMQASGARDSKSCVTDDKGRCSFSGLSTDAEYSYRVNVPYQRARYSSTPFRLDADRGQRVQIRRLPTTTSDDRLFQVLGRTMIEFRDDRAHVTQEATLANLGRETYVFPEEGFQFDLPSGFKAFDSSRMMTDQRLSANERGFEINGSIPPGRARLSWAYDLPLGGNALEFEQRVPFRTMEYQVISDFVDGMRLEVEGFPPGEIVEGRDRRYLVSRLVRNPREPSLDPLRISLRGIPGGGLIRYAAVGLAALFVVLGVVLLLRPSKHRASTERSRDHRKRELLDLIADLERERKSGKVGPKYYERQRRELSDELAILLRIEHEEIGD